MSFGYDEEAIYQDADIEQAEMIELGNHIASLEASGVCTHQGVRALKCSGCGRQFKTDDDWDEARASAIA